ncbi:YceH family protein [Thaumasiovibrio sp. DFM-14]|uniref:YceH family protein n=1 Tax=Thaumasiovibrio sp. DFM-14 TaxID=3384792 RepID=UPI0039A2B409
MDIALTPVEARVIGCLLEKEVTTPDLYPLTLNALTNACNQKSNREPVMQLSDAEVMDSLQALKAKRLISDDEAFGGRSIKYKHRFCNTEFGSLKLTEQQFGIVCALLLRGAQTPGELRTRTNRLCTFEDVKQVEKVLDTLSAHETGTLVVKLPREAGKRESRYMHQFCGDVDVSAVAVEPSTSQTSNNRVAELESEVAELRQRIKALEDKLDSLI